RLQCLALIWKAKLKCFNRNQFVLSSLRLRRLKVCFVEIQPFSADFGTACMHDTYHLLPKGAKTHSRCHPSLSVCCCSRESVCVFTRRGVCIPNGRITDESLATLSPLCQCTSPGDVTLCYSKLEWLFSS